MKRFVFIVWLLISVIEQMGYPFIFNGYHEEKTRCFITTTIIGGYAGYTRLGIKLLEEENYLVAEVYKSSPEAPYLTKFDENGQIIDFTRPSILIEKRYFSYEKESFIKEVISSLIAKKLGSPSNFNASKYTKSKGGCDNVGSWIHFESSDENFFLFEKEGQYEFWLLWEFIQEGKKKPRKIKNH